MCLLAATAQGQLRPPSKGRSIGDYTLRDFAAKWMMQQDDPAGPYRYAEADATLPAENDRRPPIVFIGDPITELWTAPDGRASAAGRWINRGISGQNTTRMPRFEDDVAPLSPAVMVITGGTNDLRACAGPPAGVVEGALPVRPRSGGRSPNPGAAPRRRRSMTASRGASFTSSRPRSVGTGRSGSGSSSPPPAPTPAPR